MWTASPPIVGAEQLALARRGMAARISIPNASAVSTQGPRRSGDGLRRAVEGDEVAVAGVLHHRGRRIVR